MATVFVSVGSNINKEQNVASAIKMLNDEFGKLIKSSIYQSEAVGFDGDDFFNMVVSFETQKTPTEVVKILDAIEKAHGRVKTSDSFVSRSLDLDQILYDELVCNDDGLNLPSNEINQYAFIAVPLAEIAGSQMHPTLHRSYSDICNDIGEAQKQVERVEL